METRKQSRMIPKCIKVHLRSYCLDNIANSTGQRSSAALSWIKDIPRQYVEPCKHLLTKMLLKIIENTFHVEQSTSCWLRLATIRLPGHFFPQNSYVLLCQVYKKRKMRTRFRQARIRPLGRTMQELEIERICLASCLRRP